MGVHEPLTSRERTARRRAALRSAGMRPKQFWLLDLRDPEVLARIARECAVIVASDQSEDLAFAEALQYWPEDDGA